MNNPNASLTDAELVSLAKGGELAAFEELAGRYERKVYGLALGMLRNRHDAEDVTQQAFMSAIGHLDGFRGESGFGTWLLRIATHAALKVVRKRKGLDTVPLDEAGGSEDGMGGIVAPEFIADWRDSPERLVGRNETRRLLDDALGQLDEKHRAVFLLRDVDGLSIRETAEVLGLGEANVKVRLLRARLRLREILTRAFGDPERRVAAGHEHGRRGGERAGSGAFRSWVVTLRRVAAR